MPQVTRTRFGLTNRLVILHAQILTLPTIPVVVLGPPGVGFRLCFLSAFFNALFSAGAYTNIDAAAGLDIRFNNFGPEQGLDLVNDAGPGFTLITDLFGNAGINRVTIGGSSCPDTVFGVNVASGVIQGGIDENVGFILRFNNGASGNLTGGNVANKLMVTTFYSVVSTQ